VVTSLGLVQMTRKRIGQGLLESFSEPCEVCNGRGVRVHLEPVEARSSARHSGENVDRVERVARAAKARKGSPADGETTEGADGATVDRADEPAAKPRRRRATKAQGAPAPVG
jgi:ribonuclease E